MDGCTRPAPPTTTTTPHTHASTRGRQRTTNGWVARPGHQVDWGSAKRFAIRPLRHGQLAAQAVALQAELAQRREHGGPAPAGRERAGEVVAAEVQQNQGVAGPNRRQRAAECVVGEADALASQPGQAWRQCACRRDRMGRHCRCKAHNCKKLHEEGMNLGGQQPGRRVAAEPPGGTSKSPTLQPVATQVSAGQAAKAGGQQPGGRQGASQGVAAQVKKLQRAQLCQLIRQRASQL